MAEGKLRIGVLCDNLLMQRWQLDCLSELQKVPGVNIVVVVMRAPSPLEPRSFLRRLRDRPWRTTLYRAYRHRWSKPAAMEPVDASGLLGQLPCLQCKTIKKGQSEYFSPADIERLRDHRPDVLLRFGFNIIRGDILQLPRHGVWSFHHGDEQKYRGGPPGLWEIMAGDPVTGAVLQRLNERLDGGLILRKGWFSTVDHSLSETVDTVLTHSAIWPAQVCREILAGNDQAAVGTPSGSDAPLFKYPLNVQFLRFLWRQGRNKVRFHRAELNKHEEWNIGVLHQPIHSLLNEGYNSHVQWLPPPAAGQFRADPFGYWMDGQLNVLYERFDQALGRSKIARVRPKPDNNLKRSRTMLDMEQHLSYPFIVEEGGTIHVVPEQAALGRVDLYRLLPNNDGLEWLTTLLDEPLIDPTVFKHEGRWWLFGTKKPLTNVELFAYHSDNLRGPFRPHLLNPIKTDIRSARPAGTPFVHDGALWRPAQDSSLTYGGRISMNRVLTLTPTAFAEETFTHIEPMIGRWSHGLHTLSAAGEYTLVDGKHFITDPSQRSRVRKRKVANVLKQPPSTSPGGVDKIER